MISQKQIYKNQINKTFSLLHQNRFNNNVLSCILVIKCLQIIENNYKIN